MTSAPSRTSLLKVLGVGFGVAVIVGNTVGAGIMRTPGDIAARLPSTAAFLAVWIFGGLYALLASFSLAELGVMLPRSGGQYVFARHTFGPAVGFAIGWTDWVSTAASVAAISIVIGEYTGALVPSLGKSGAMVAIATVLAFTVLQWRGIRWADRAQQFTSVAKALALLAIVAACFLLRPDAAEAARTAAASAPSMTFAAVVLAVQAVLYTYDGWNGVLYFSEEVRDPARGIPRSMFVGVLSVIAIYLLLNLAMLHVLGIHGLAGSTFAAGDAARTVFGARGDVIIRLTMILSLLSAVNANLLMGSRVPYAMARDGIITGVASRVNDGGTPTVTLVATAVLAAVLIATGTFATAAAIAAFFFVLQYVVSFSAVFVLRRREPERPRGYRAWGFPYTTALTLIGSVAFLAAALAQDTKNSLIALGLLSLSFPVYRAYRPAAKVSQELRSPD